jgi:hypothetical protein
VEETGESHWPVVDILWKESLNSDG